MKGDVLQLLPGIEADIAYFDPPYPATASYEKEYRILDEIFEGKFLPPSPFSDRSGGDQLDRLLSQASHIPLWVLSFGNAVCSLEELESKMAAHGRQVRALELPYAHKANVATKAHRDRDREFIVVGWNPESKLFRGVHSLAPGETLLAKQIPEVTSHG